MTRKDFVLIAEALSVVKPKPDVEKTRYSARNIQRIIQWNYTVTAIANRLEAANPRFDIEIFLRACGYGE